MGKEGILGEAEYHIRRLMPSITTGARPTPRHGGWWRPMGAASHRAHARSFRPKATQAIGPNPVPTHTANAGITKESSKRGSLFKVCARNKFWSIGHAQ